MKCFMVELFSSYKSRENYKQGITEIVFDEAIINPKTGEKYLEDEEGKIKELLENNPPSPQPKLTYIANPYERFRPFMANFLPLIRKRLSKLKSQVFNNEIVNLENEQGELLSLYKPSKCLKEKDLKITEFINGSAPIFIFNNCILYQAKKGFFFFVNKDNKEISNKEEIKFIPEYYVNNEQRLNSQQEYQVPIEENYLREDLLWK
ncbi:9099_t:CDS:2 [Entrophospora sp. SA101]|nr:3944_t:CDS:2 [Entrophospora sp. SA101]CAJ0844966.1 9099_t:CDS:2 [Entrophospora sp. SA101]